MLQFLSSLRGQISEQALREGRRIIADYTSKELSSALLDSDQIDWKKKPGFYKATAEEMRARLQRITDSTK